jgi:hypothetical protein
MHKEQLNRVGICAWPDDAHKPIEHDESLTGDGSEAAPLSAAAAIAAAVAAEASERESALAALIQEAEDEATAESLSAANPSNLYVVPEEEA